MSPSRRVIIVGGVAGGMSAATRLRRLDENAEIVVYERGEHVSYANCGLPYYVGGVIEDRAALLVQTPDALHRRFRLDVRPRHEVLEIDASARRARVRSLATGTETWDRYDQLVLATGAAPVTGLPGGGVPVRSLHTVADVDEIVALLDGIDTPRVVVVGAGFIGIEAAENLRRRGAAVVLVQKGSQPLNPLDPEMASPVVDELERHGVDLLLGATVAALHPGTVILDDGREIPADLVVDARGVRPDVRLATAAGLRIGPSGGVAVDAFQQTSDPAIWAVGDAAEKTDAIDERPTLVTMAGLANRHGRTAADAIAGEARISRPSLGTAIIGVFDLTVAITGWNETRLRAAGRPHRIVHTHPLSHAGYYPGAQQMSIKLLIDADDDRILGAQVVGREGVDKRIDVIATAMAGGLTASDLADLELAYAPQYGSAKDAVNLVGYVAENQASGGERTLQWHELDTERARGAALVDVRSAGEFARGAIPGSVNVPLDELRERRSELPRGPLVVTCQVGQRGHTATRLLQQWGHDVRNLDGGYRTWLAGRDAESRSAALVDHREANLVPVGA